MSNAINLGNLGAPQASPAAQGLAGQTASQGANSSLFSAFLMQQMGDTLPVQGQNLSDETEAMKLLPALMAQLKDSKFPAPANHQTDNAADSADNNSAMAAWIASMAVMQMQPNVQSPSPQLKGFSPEPAGPGTGQNAVLQALEQQFPASVLKGTRLPDAKELAGKVDADATVNSDAKKVDPKGADVKVTDAKVADVKTQFDAALNSVQTAEPKKPDVQQPPAHMNADMSPVVQKISATPDKNIVDAKSQIANAAGKDIQPQLVPGNQGPSPDAKSQSQGQSQSQPQAGDSHADNQQPKKDSASPTQAQHQANGASGTAVTAPDQDNFAVLTQAPMHNSPANNSNHTTSSAPSQELGVRDIGSVAPSDPAPRIVQAGRLMEAAGQAEMRVSVKSDLGGTVDVRAMLEGGNISATVAAQHSGTRDWMMSNMHELQGSLSRDDLNLKTFEVTDSGLQNSAHGDEPRQQERQQRNPTYSSFTDETHSTPTSFDAVDSQETESRVLSLLA